MVDQRVKEPLKKARAFLFAVAPLLKELVPELLQVFAHLRYSVSLKEIESWVKGKGHMDRSIALGDAFREQKFLRLFHSKELKKGLEDLDSYLSQLTDPGGLLSDHFDNPNLVQ